LTNPTFKHGRADASRRRAGETAGAIGRILLVTTALAAGVGAAPAIAQTVAIVGTGTAACSRFTAAIAARPIEEREYFSWAQGYMSGILLSAPPGVDEGLALTSDALPIPSQLAFVKAFCERYPSASYSDSVETLYRALGGKAIK
jgi:hypothetical protein